MNTFSRIRQWLSEETNTEDNFVRWDEEGKPYFDAQAWYASAQPLEEPPVKDQFPLSRTIILSFILGFALLAWAAWESLPG